MLELLLWKPGLPQKLSCPSVGDCPSQCSPGVPDHCQEGLELVHRLLQVPQLVLSSVRLLLHTWVGETLSGYFAYGAKPPTHTESLYSQINAKCLLLGRGQNRGTSYLPWCWCHYLLRELFSTSVLKIKEGTLRKTRILASRLFWPTTVKDNPL